jgi:hypothetical protein
MYFLRLPLKKLSGLIFFLLAPLMLTAQVTTITVGTTPVQSSVKRFGINLGDNDFYDSGQMLKNLVFTNPSFEGEIYQSTIECGGNTYVTPNQPAGTANSCTDADIYAGFTGGFWNYASYTVISGAAVGRTGTVCSYAAGAYPGGGVFTFCDSGTAPAQGDYIVVKTTLPTNVGWPGGDWQTVVGNGVLTAETNDLPPSTTGKQSALLTAPTANDSIGVNMFFDSTKNETFVQLNGTYQLTFKAKGVSGSEKLAILLNRANAGLTYINQTESLSSSWQTYTINFNASENGTDTGRVELSFSTVGADTAELDDVSLVQTNTNPANTTVFRDEVVNALQALHPGVIRLWDDQLGESLDNLLAGPQGRQRAGYTPFPGFDGTDVNFQTQSVEIGLTDFLQLCQTVGADPWIVVPSTFSTGEAYGLIDYLAGSGSTTYGAKRVAAGQTAPWTSVFHQIHLEFGNEEWNGGTFKGGAIELAPAYGQAATTIFASIKNNPNYVASSFDLIVNGQSANPGGNQYIQSQTLNNDSFSVAPYMMYTITSFGSNDQLFGTTFAEAEAFVGPTCAQGYPPPPCNNAAEGVNGGYITEEQSLVGKPIVTSEMNLSPSAGTITQAALNGFTSSVAGGIAVLDSMFQQLRAGVLTQNLYELPGWESSTAVSPYDSMYLWGAMVDMGVTNRPRPQYLALQLADNAIGGATTEVQTTQSGSNPTDPQYAYGLNTVTLQTFHLLQSFAFTGSSNGSSSLVVFNVSPDYAEQVNFAGAVPSGTTVAVQQLTSVNPTDNNEAASVVSTTSSSIPSFNPSTAITLPPFSMTSFTWGGTSSAPVISAVTATSVTPTSETITWTTDQASTSQVNYGTTTAYGSSSTLNSTLTTSHSVTLTGLTAGTAYDFDAVSANSVPLTTTSGNSTFTTSAVPPVISNVVATPVTPTSETITWTTDQASSSQVSFGTTTAYGFQSALNSTLTTTHSVTISTNLTAGTTYDFDVASTNAQNATGTSSNSTFTTQTAPPIISAVTATAVSPTSETITWTTDQASTSVVNFGGTTSYGSQMSSSTMLTSHSVTLTGLTQGTNYDFDVVSVNAASQSTTSANSSFLTLTPAPAISAITVSSITTTGATITWTTDLASSSQVFYGTNTAYGSQSTLNSTLVTAHSVLLTGLTAGTTYDFEVASTNSPGGTSLSTNSTFVTLTTPPFITNVVATAVSPTSETITWTTDQNSSSVVNYGGSIAYGSSASGAGGVTSHTVTLNGLTGGATYQYDVSSTNASSQTGTTGNFSFTTLTPSPTISAVTATAITTTTATITWTTDLNSSSTVNYGATTGYGSSATGAASTTAHSVNLSGLTPGTTYDFDAVSTNSPGGTSTSANFTFTTVNVAPTISAVNSTGITASSATITWTTNEAASSQVNYGTTMSYGSSSTLNSGLVTSHSVTITGLASGTAYDFDVVSANSSSQSTTSGNSSFTTTAVPPVISAVTATAIGTTTATITWTTDQNSSSVVNYGTTASYGSNASGGTSVTSHSVSLTGLAPGTTYDYEVTSANAGNGSATSSGFTFATNPVPPTITNVLTSGTTSVSTTITWTTDQASTSQVFYGPTSGYGSSSTLNSSLVTTHAVTITGLTAGATYHFDVASTNTSTTLTGTSTDSSFVTLGAPAISAIASSPTSTTATITWTTDQPSSSQVNYGTTTSYGSQSAFNNSLVTAHSVTINGLTPGTMYDFDVVSANGSSVSSTSGNSTFTTTASPVISAVASSVTSVSATITWTTDQSSSSGVNYGTTTGYGSSGSGAGSVTSHSVTLTGLTPGTMYNFDLVSTNGSGGTTTSGNFTFTTTPPPAISAVTASGITSTGATITWTTDQNSTSAVNYGTTSSYGSTTSGTGSVMSHSVTLTGLTAGTTYDYDVTSVNGSTASATSGNFSFLTTPVAPVISAVVVSGSTTTTATINWTTDQPSSSQVFFGTTTGYGSSSPLNSTLTTTHSVTITGLSPTTTYDFDVASTNSFSLTAVSGNFSFVTPAGVPPQVGYVVAWGITNTSAVVTWSTDVSANTQLAYGTTMALGQLSTLQTTMAASHGVTLSNLIPGTQYYFQAMSTGANGATGSSATMSFTTTGTAPVGPPVISSVAVGSITNTSATITWTTDQPSTSLVNFGTTTGYGSNSTLDSTLVTSHSVTLTGLTLGTTYDFDVVSANSGAMSANSTNSTFLTTSVVNTPPVITNVATTNLTSTSVTVTWTTDQPATSLVNYGTSLSYGSSSPLSSTLVTAHSVTLTGLAAGTAYDFDVVSANAAAQSTTSPNATFSTPATTATPPQVGYVVAWGINNTSAVVTWSTDVSANTQLAYGTTTSLGQLSTLQTAMAASHGVSLAGLTPGTTYYYQAQSTGADGATGYSTVMSFTTTGTAPVGPPVISNVLVSSITNTSATITWTTDQASSSQVNFGTTTAYGSNSTLDSTMVTSHSVTLTGLTLGTTYDFDVVSANSASLSATSGNSSFLTTSVSFTPPVITNVTTTNLTSTSVTVTWTTDQPSWSQVNYGTTTGYGSSSPQNTTLVTAHSVTLTGLAASTAYDFDVVSTNAASQSTTSPNATFSTPATTATPPYVGYVAAWGINNTGAIVTWSTDVAASAQLAYGTSTALGQMSPLQPALTASHGVTLTGLASGTTYYFVAQSTAANGATGYSAVMSFTTTGQQTTPPPVISNLTVSGITNTTATITWTTDEASTSQANYGVTTTYTLSSTLDPTLVTSHSVTLTGLTPGTLYDFDVMSTNSVSLSTTSSNATFTTTGTAPGPVITNVSSSGVTSGTATIAWTTDEASSSVVNYGTTTGYGSTTTQAPLVTTHSVTLTGLTANTTYNFDVASANAANTTTASTNFTFKTTSNTAPPPVISYLSYWGITATQATITWSTDELTNTAVAYGTTNALGQLSPVQTALTNSHGVTLTGLNPGTTYYFVAQSADGSGNTGYSTTYSFTTLAGPPTISGVTATPAANNTATINWTTSAPTTSYVVYGLTTSYGYYSSMTSSTTTPHCTLSYVPSGTIHYQLISQDANGNQVVSPDMTFVEP